MKTVVLQIGNSDDKLRQCEWSEFVKRLHAYLQKYPIHFSGGSSPDKEWQNYCFVFEASDSDMDEIKKMCGFLCRDYRQDSIAMTTGETIFTNGG